MAKKVSSDTIYRRLNIDTAAAAPITPVKNDDDGSPMSAAFLAIVFALMIAVGGGTFYFFSSGSNFRGSLSRLMAYNDPKSFVSQADSRCKGLWIANANNSPTLVCYLTTNVARLCDAAERKHLALVMQEYRLARNAFNGRMTMNGMNAVAVMRGYDVQGNIGKLAMFIEESDKKPPTRSQKTATDEHFNMLGKMHDAAGNGVESALAIKQTPDEQISLIIKQLGEQGYMSKGDFGWFTDPLVEKAYEKLGPVKDRC